MSLIKDIFSSTIGRKIAMALSAFFLMIFLLQHLTINMTSVFSAELFNELSHFMGTNPVVQFLLQPVLIFGVVFHFVMGFILEIKNNKARAISYAKNNASANSSWFSRNMIWTGLFILFFLVFHFKDFWIHEITIKYVKGDMSGLINPESVDSGFRYYQEVVAMFENPLRVLVYVLAFVFLAMHLLHGFNSSFQSVGINNKYTDSLQKVGVAYAILVPLGFIFIAVYHYVSAS
ncbi:MAG: succinate dehydrogenase cytochrome b subunit [Cyclobacteriaceae bacterium]